MLSLTKKKIGTIACAAVVAALFTVSVAGPAKADDRDWRRHEWDAHRWHRAHHHPVPYVVYAPPVVVAPPPPAYVAPAYVSPAPVSPSLNFIIPLHIH